ncbi:hypothetical protein EH243_08290 [Amphritea opalescens]|uniref:DUF4258 domain-containing protein n=1 Tax=Amphritea opalescens TaxID=2490544 RepID=A0A430KRH0_9GAMM|nr:hypothetical protein [Amphritea opalescens]RTE66109.1 hypothetical protein EH243_08290 [Amphritea opalescens]
MMITQHARKRLKQRAIPDAMASLIINYGKEMYQKGGTYKYQLTKRDAKHLKQDLNRVLNHLDSLSDTYLIESEDGRIITVGHII